MKKRKILFKDRLSNESDIKLQQVLLDKREKNYFVKVRKISNVEFYLPTYLRKFSKNIVYVIYSNFANSTL